MPLSEYAHLNIYIKYLTQVFKFTQYMPCIKRETNVVQNDTEKEQKDLVIRGTSKDKLVLPKPTSFVNEIYSQFEYNFVNVIWKIFITIQ